MSVYDDLVTNIRAVTNRSSGMSTEIDLAIRQALRAAHRSGLFVRDLVTVTVTGLSTTSTTGTQTIDLSVSAPRFRQMAQVQPTGLQLQYDEVLLADLFDLDGFYKTDVYYGIGQQIVIRPTQPQTSVDITYFQAPLVSPLSSLDSWIATDHQDLIVFWASATILSMLGEQEIKSRIELLAKTCFDDLIQDSLQLSGR